MLQQVKVELGSLVQRDSFFSRHRSPTHLAAAIGALDNFRWALASMRPDNPLFACVHKGVEVVFTFSGAAENDNTCIPDPFVVYCKPSDGLAQPASSPGNQPSMLPGGLDDLLAACATEGRRLTVAVANDQDWAS